MPGPPLLHRLPDVCAIGSGLADTHPTVQEMAVERSLGGTVFTTVECRLKVTHDKDPVSAIYCNSRCHITNHPKTTTLFLVHGSGGRPLTLAQLGLVHSQLGANAALVGPVPDNSKLQSPPPWGESCIKFSVSLYLPPPPDPCPQATPFPLLNPETWLPIFLQPGGGRGGS